MQKDEETAELDRIIVFPPHEGKGVGTLLLRQVILDQKQGGGKNLIVHTEEGEAHARRFYEKNGFEKIGEAGIEAPWGGKLSIVTYKLSLENG